METITYVNINQIEAAPWNRSIGYDKSVITKLRKNIRALGGINKDHPIIVNKKDNGKFTIIDGGAKLIAAKMENIATVPVIVKNLDYKDAALKFLDINIQHKMNNLTIGKIGLLIKRTNNELKIGTIAGMLSEATGKDKSNISKFIKSAEVYEFTEDNLTEPEKAVLYRKSSKLHKISNLPREVWFTLVKYIVSSAKCEHLNKAINLVNSITNIENNKLWRDVFFPLNEMVSMSLKNATGLVAIKESFKKLNDALDHLKLTKNENKINDLKKWLVRNAFKKRDGTPVAYRFRKIIKHVQKIINQTNTHVENLIYGDCLEKIELLENNTVDACITDPPYGISMHRIGRNKIPIVNDTRESATNLIYSFAQKLYSKMKNNTYSVIFSSDKMLDVFKDAFTTAGFKYVCLCVWKKRSHSQCDMVSSPLIVTEFILLFRKGRPTWFEGRNNVFEFNTPTSRVHPAEKPLDLMVEIIKCTSSENSLVIDPFCGSGSTAKACQLTNRNFWTCEISKSHYETAYNRLFGDNQNEAA